MKSSKKEAFLNYLKSQIDWINASTIANYFKISTRTVRKYVNEINLSGDVILSSKQGYKLNLANKSNLNIPKEVTDNPLNRLNMILKELVINTEGIDIFDLSENFFVSFATIEGDILKANRLLDKFNLKIKQSKYLLKLYGDEAYKRKLMSHIICEETGNNFLSLFDVQKIYKEYNLGKLKENVIFILEKYNLFINEYTINNILLHLIITIDRIKNNNHIESYDLVKSSNSNNEINIAKDLSEFINSEYDITLSDSELYYLVFQLTNKTTLLNYHHLDTKSLSNYIDNNYINLTTNIIKNVYDTYFIDFSRDDDFFVRFTLHVKNLIHRARNEQQLKNKIPQKLKDSYPLIYDISVYIANQLEILENIDIDEDEIAYISLHVGSFFDRKKILENKVLCAVVTPNYYGAQVKLVNDLERKFSDSLEIIQVSSDNYSLKFDDKVEMVITTLPLMDDIDLPYVSVKPYLNQKDYNNIQNTFLQINERKNILTLQNHLEMFFSESLFMKNIYLDNGTEYIKYMASILYENNYVGPDYVDDVLKRENMSSTAFNNNVAVPHTMKMGALKTGVFIIINDKPVKWGDEKVQIIAMIPINEKEKEIFNHVFESFIDILSDWENVKELVKADSYSDFMNRIAYLINKI